MRTRLIIFLSILSLGICSCYDDSALQEQLLNHEQRILQLERFCNQLNTNIESIQGILSALQENDSVTGVFPVTENGKEIGYTINFSRSGSITIYHGDKGDAPVIGVREYDGRWYWTLDGKWMLDGYGNMIPTTGENGIQGITPTLKIQDQFWYVSYDNGYTWEKLKRAVGQDGEDGDAFFQNVEIGETEITMILADGQTFKLPIFRTTELRFNIEGNEAAIRSGETISFSYTLENVSESTVVTAGSDGHYMVKVIPYDTTSGVIEVECPDPYVDGYINVTAVDKNGYSILKVIYFYEKQMYLSEGDMYAVTSEGGLLSIPAYYNFDYYITVAEQDQEWISAVDTKAEYKNGTIDLSISRNYGTTTRAGTVYVYAENNVNDPYCQISILQASSMFSQHETTLIADDAGEVLTTTVTSSSAVTFNTEELPEWISASAEKVEDEDTYVVSFTIAANNEDQKRSVEVHFYAEDMITKMGSITIIQLESDQSDHSKDMVFRARVNFSNDFTCRLPIYPKPYEEYYYDFYVDWGDGTIEYYNSHIWDENYKSEVVHKYEGLSEGKTFEIRVSGIVESLRGSYVNGIAVEAHENSITEVVQWGNTGLKDLSNAFAGYSMLKSIPEDNSYAFAEVTDCSYAFHNCGSLTDVPEGLFKNCRKSRSFKYCFSSCSELVSLPEGLFENCKAAIDFSNCFFECRKLETLPDGLFSDLTEAMNFDSCFQHCKSISSLPDNMFENCIKAEYFSSCFFGCSSLSVLPASLFADCSYATDFRYCFCSCTSLIDTPTSLFDNNRKVSSFEATFSNCPKYKGESPYTEINGVKYHLYERAFAPDYFVRPTSYFGCFYACNKLTDWDNIPSEWRDL